MPKRCGIFLCSFLPGNGLDRDCEMLYILVNEIYNIKSRISKSGKKGGYHEKQYDVVIIGAGVGAAPLHANFRATN